jgi:hypothetical protein
VYASGELAEVWFDGGYPPGTEDLIPALLQQLQPNAVAFQGLEHVIGFGRAAGIMPVQVLETM